MIKATNLFCLTLIFSAILVLSCTGIAQCSEIQSHTFEVAVPRALIEDGVVVLEDYVNSTDPGNPQLPQKGFSAIVHPDIDWETLEVELVDKDCTYLPDSYSIKPAPPAVSKVIENGKSVTRFYHGEGKTIVDGKNTDIYGEDKLYPEDILELLPYSQLRKWKMARVLFRPVQYNPVTGEVRVTTKATIKLTYRLQTAGPELSIAMMSDTVADARARAGAVNFDEMKDLYISPTAEDGVMMVAADAYDYCIITTNYIISNSTKLQDYIDHKEEQFYSILVKTVGDIEAEYTMASRPELFETTDERADRIKAFLKDKYSEYGFEWVLLIGNPTPVTGDVPMKFCEPDGYDAPTDSFYTDLTGQWDLDMDQIYGEHPDDAGPGGVDFAYPELYVCRIPVYSTDLGPLDAILQKTVDYEDDMANESWRKSCFMPEPIDSSDSAGSEGNLSPITMAEYIKNSHLIPNAFSYYRIYEHKYNWYPINVSPDPEKTPDNPGHTCVTYYSSTLRFKGAFNTTSSDIVDYTIDEMTDNNDATYYATDMQQNDWLQFKQSYSSYENSNYVPDRIIVRSTSESYLPQQFIIQMASDGAFGDAYTIVMENDADAHATKNGAYWELQYDYPSTLTSVGSRRYIRLKYTGSAAQSTVRINEFLMYTEEHKSIKPYVIPEWQNGYGICYYNTHGSSTSASDIISSSECSQLDDAKPAFVFQKACSNAYPESSTNLAYSLLKEGAIAALGSSRVSYGLGDAGYPKLFPRLCADNDRFGQMLGDMKSEMDINGELGWGGLFADCMRFNIYGDPTVALLADAEEDGMPYWWELHYGLDPSIDDAGDDPDEDGLINYMEYVIGTDPTVPNTEDTDVDGMLDPWEVYYFGNLSQGANDDYDFDGLNNIGEYEYGLDPINPSTDGDEAKDGVEIDYGSDPKAFTYFVDDAGGDDSNDGFLPFSDEGHGPKKTIQAGVDAAAGGEEVAVLDGSYSGPGNRDIDLDGKAVAMKGLGGAENTVIDCENSGRGFYCDFVPSPGAVIDGFTITNGNTSDRGGGIYCSASTLTVESCVVTGNTSTGDGGGICCRESSEVTVTNCLVTGNTGGGKGGGIFCGMSDIDINNVTVEGNSSPDFGGGIMMSWGSEGTMTDSIFWGNTAAEGAQIALKATAQPSTLSVSYCDVEGGQSGAYVESGCVLNWGSGNLDSDPLFATGPSGAHYLSQTASGQASNSPCVDTGSDTAQNIGLDEMTTRTDGVSDTGDVDIGYHYPVPPEPLAVGSIERTDDDVTVTWNAVSGVSYTVQHSTDMENWTDVPVGETDHWTDYGVSETKKFYRVHD